MRLFHLLAPVVGLQLNQPGTVMRSDNGNVTVGNGVNVTGRHASYDCAPGGVPAGTVNSNYGPESQQLVDKARRIEAAQGHENTEDGSFSYARVHAARDCVQADVDGDGAYSQRNNSTSNSLGDLVEPNTYTKEGAINYDLKPGTKMYKAVMEGAEAVKKFQTVKQKDLGLVEAGDSITQAGIVLPE